MSTPAPTDLFLVQRAAALHQATFAQLPALLDDDLVLVQRGTTHYKASGAELKAWLAPVVGGEPWTPLDEPSLYLWVDGMDPLKRTIAAGRVSQVVAQNDAQFIFGESNAAEQPIVKPDGGIGLEPASVDVGMSLQCEHTPVYSGPLMVLVGGGLDGIEQQPRKLNGLCGIRDQLYAATALSVLGCYGNYANPGSELNAYELGITGADPQVALLFRLSGIDQGTATGVWKPTPGNNPTCCLVMSQSTASWGEDWHFVVCSDAQPDRPFRGSFYDLVLLTPTAADDLALAQRLEGWAMHRYGRASELPDDHPYKNAPPIKPAS